MTLKTPLVLATLGLFSLTACVDPNAYPGNPNGRTEAGAITGALVGGVIGANQRGSNKLLPALVGPGSAPPSVARSAIRWISRPPTCAPRPAAIPPSPTMAAT